MRMAHPGTNYDPSNLDCRATALCPLSTVIVNRLAVFNRTPFRFALCRVVSECLIGYDAQRFREFKKPCITTFGTAIRLFFVFHIVPLKPIALAKCLVNIFSESTLNCYDSNAL